MKYVGITIGPIVETICETTKPAGLWFASSLFSDITRRLCLKISGGSLQGEILSPYFDGTDEMKDGVGKYHDRVIFKTNQYDKEELNRMIAEVKKETLQAFEINNESTEDEKKIRQEEFLMQYLQINYVTFGQDKLPDANSILAVSPYLDAIELMKTMPVSQEDSPFDRMFHGQKNSVNKNGNYYVMNSRLFQNTDPNSNQFRAATGRRIRDIEEIAQGIQKTGTDLKKTAYFATVSADGDGMGAFLKSLSEDADVSLFSKACLDYDKEAAELVRTYGGMTIYAGGDDLLFLSPLDGILKLCSSINDLFREKVGAAFQNREEVLKHIPTISFGIAVRYYKFPLYEALANSRALLGTVKNLTSKNAIAIQVEKHSGQSFGLFIPHSNVDVVNHLLKTGEETAEVNALEVNRVIYTLEMMKELIKTLDRQELNSEQYWNSWKNFFDNSEQKKAEGFHRSLCDMYYESFKKNAAGILSLTDVGKEDEPDSLRAFTMLLRLVKFMKEKKGEQE